MDILALQPFIRVSLFVDLTSDMQLRRHPQLNAKPMYPVHVWSRRVDGLLTTIARSRKCATRGQRFTSASGRNCSPMAGSPREDCKKIISLFLPSRFDFYVRRNYELWLGNSSHPALLIPSISSLLRVKDLIWC